MQPGSIRAVNLRLGYGGDTVLSLDEFTAEPGEFISVLGPSGCGKSTLLGALAGFVQPQEGRVEIDGEDVTFSPPHRRPTGMVFQSYALFPHMTVEQNLHYGLKARKVPKAERESRVREGLELVHLEDFRTRYPAQLSGGQQQRVAIARALVTRPSVLLLDEPLSNLDAKLRRQMRDELREIQQRVGTTMVFVTHDQAEALAMSDRVVLLSQGKLEQQGSPDELYRSPRTAFAADFIGGANLLRDEDQTSALRPEAIRILGSQEQPSTDEIVVEGEVLSSLFAGERYEHKVRISSGTELRSASPQNLHPLNIGESVRLNWPRAALVPVEDS